MTTAHLNSARVVRVSIGLDHSAVVLLVDDSLDLYEWLRSKREPFRGRATGKRFRLTIDNVAMDARRVFVRPSMHGRQVFLTVTSWPGETSAAAFGRKVGKTAYAVSLMRTAATRAQGELTAKVAGPKRVTVVGADQDQAGAAA